jgi:hypothetical protein
MKCELGQGGGYREQCLGKACEGCLIAYCHRHEDLKQSHYPPLTKTNADTGAFSHWQQKFMLMTTSDRQTRLSLWGPWIGTQVPSNSLEGSFM